MRIPGDIDYKTLANCLIKLVLMVVLARVSGGYGLAIFGILAVSALVSNRNDNLLFVILMIISMTMGSAILIPKNVISFIVMRGALMLISVPLAVKIFGRRLSPWISPLLSILFYLFYMGLASARGWCPIISELKLILFVSIFLAFFGAANLVLLDARSHMDRIRAMMLSLACFFVFGSLLSIPFPSVSIMDASILRDNPDLPSLFCGITNHSQCLGPCCAMIGTLVLGDLLFGVGKLNKLYVALLLTIPILIYKTASRTAMGSMLAGFMLVVFFFCHARNGSRAWRSKVINVMLMVGVVAALVIAITPGGRKSAVNFINKRAEQGSALDIDAVIAARGGKAEECMASYRKSPLFGNGFQVSEEMTDRKVNGIVSILSAPIEKGFIVAAILEEGGCIGFALFGVFVLIVCAKLIRRRAYIGVSAFVVFLITNMGEFSFFSMTYTGGLLWACTFLGFVLDGCRNRSEYCRSFPVWTMIPQ